MPCFLKFKPQCSHCTPVCVLCFCRMWFARSVLLAATLLHPGNEQANDSLEVAMLQVWLLAMFFWILAKSFLTFSSNSFCALRSWRSLLMLLRHCFLSLAVVLQSATMFNCFKAAWMRSCHLCFWPPWHLLPFIILLTKFFLQTLIRHSFHMTQPLQPSLLN